MSPWVARAVGARGQGSGGQTLGVYVCLGGSPKVVGFCQAPASNPSFLGVGLTLRQHLSASAGASAAAVEEALGLVTDGSRRLTDARAPAGRPWGGPVVLGGVSSIGAAWVVSGTGRGGGWPLLHACRPSWSTGLGTGSGIPHYLRPFPASSAGCRAAVFPRPHLEQVTPGCRRQRAWLQQAPRGSGSGPLPSTS